MSDEPEKKDPFDGEYIGNIWGWRMSMIGAAVMALLISLAAYRHYTLGVPFGFEDPEQTEERVEADSSDTPSLPDEADQ